MASSQEPFVFADPPEKILEFAGRNGAIALNLRPDHWPDELIQQFRNDRLWQTRAALENGYFVCPYLTDFLKEVGTGDPVLICCQEAKGEICTVVNTIDNLYWPGRSVEKHKGLNVGIRLKKSARFGATGGSVWSTYVLAMTMLARRPHATSRSDVDGQFFLEIASRYGTMQQLRSTGT